LRFFASLFASAYGGSKAGSTSTRSRNSIAFVRSVKTSYS
jgi:hypothetical protein